MVIKELKALREADIQTLILDYLNKRGIFAFRVNNIGVYDPVKKCYRKPSKFSPKGVSDILGIYKGRFIACEVKTKTGKVSPEQIAFINKINKMGGLAFVARSVEDVIEKLKEEGY